MTILAINPDWKPLDPEEEGDEATTMAEVRVTVGNKLVSRFSDPASHKEFDGPIVPAVDLAAGLAENWWTLLYEPLKGKSEFSLDRKVDPAFEARHRLDVLLPGYVFPPIGIWSAGDGLLGRLFDADERFQHHRYIRDVEVSKRLLWNLLRTETEGALAAFIEHTLGRLDEVRAKGTALRDAWSRVAESRGDADELEWCITAGRLGFDPYDPETPDIAALSEGLSDDLFEDLCEAVGADEIGQAVNWARDYVRRLSSAPTISIEAFGGALKPDLNHAAWRNGLDAAKVVRRRLGLPLDPTEAVGRLLGGVPLAPSSEIAVGLPQVSGLARRSGKSLRAVVAANGQPSKRFSLCRAAYLGWMEGGDGEIAVTNADTRRQQASRAFAAEVAAPVALLEERAGRTGLTSDVIRETSREWACSPKTIIYQAVNNDIPMRDALRFGRRSSV